MENQENIKKAGQCLVKVAQCSIFLFLILCASFLSYFLIEDLDLLKIITAIIAIIVIYLTVSMIINLYKAGDLLININKESGLEDWKKEQEWKKNIFEKKLKEINKR